MCVPPVFECSLRSLNDMQFSLQLRVTLFLCNGACYLEATGIITPYTQEKWVRWVRFAHLSEVVHYHHKHLWYAHSSVTM